MGLPVYVVNFDELVNLIALKGVTVEMDLTEISAVFDRYFPELLDLVRAMGGEEAAGISKIKGFASQGEPMVFVAEKPLLLTGAAFSQSAFTPPCNDRWRLAVRNPENGEEIILMDEIYAKDTLQQKYFSRFYPVPAGYAVVITLKTAEAGDDAKTFWFDLSYIEVTSDGTA